MKKTVLITGATSGIGLATAQLLAEKGLKLILCGRRTTRLTQLKETLSPLTAVHTLQFDVRDKTAVAQCLASIPSNFSTIDVLINNAGNAHGLDPIQDGSLTDWDAMIDANVKGLLYLSQPIIKGMVERCAGQIINIGSSAAKEVYPKGNVYCASKHAVDAITQGMRLDLNPFGIKVSAIHPGLVETEFSEVRFKGGSQAAGVYEGYQALQAKDIAEIIYFSMSRPSHVNLADILVFPTAQANSVTLNKAPTSGS